MTKRVLLIVTLSLIILSGLTGIMVLQNVRQGIGDLVGNDAFLSLFVVCFGGAIGTVAVLGEKRAGVCVLVGLLALPLVGATITAFTASPCKFFPSQTIPELAANMVAAWNSVDVTPNQWLLIQTAYVWTEEHILYATPEEVYHTSDHWATPDETLFYRRGDCKGRVIFLCALLEQFDINAYVAVMPSRSGHAFAIIPEGKNITILGFGEEYATGNATSVAFTPESAPAQQELTRVIALLHNDGIPGRITIVFNSSAYVFFKSDAELLSWISTFSPIPGTLPTPFKPAIYGLFVFPDGTFICPIIGEINRWNALMDGIAVPSVEVNTNPFTIQWLTLALLIAINCGLLLGLTWKSRRGIRAWRYHTKMIKRMVWNLDDFAVFWLYARHETLRDATVTRLDDLNTREFTENEWKNFLSTIGGGKR